MFNINNKSVPEHFDQLIPFDYIISLQIRYNTRNRNVPNLAEHKTQILNKFKAFAQKNTVTGHLSMWKPKPQRALMNLNLDLKDQFFIIIN